MAMSCEVGGSVIGLIAGSVKVLHAAARLAEPDKDHLSNDVAATRANVPVAEYGVRRDLTATAPAGVTHAVFGAQAGGQLRFGG